MNSSKSEYQVIHELKQRKMRQWVALVPALVGVILLVIQKPVTVVAGFALVVGVLIFSLFNWRCPACNKYLGRRLDRKECPGCGARFE